MKKRLLVVVAFCAFAVQATPVEWTFPKTQSCHEGMAFSDGVTGVLVWGGDRTINLTVGRADLWDHRGGYPWLASQSYTNIVALWRTQRDDELNGMFRNEPPANWGGRYNPYMLPLGRVILTLNDDWRLLRGSLDPLTGLGRLELVSSEMGSVVVSLAMGRESRQFVMKFPKPVTFSAESVPAMERSGVRKVLEPRGFRPAVRQTDGFIWEIPEERSVSLAYALKDGSFSVATARGKAAVADADYTRVSEESVRQWERFWQEGARIKVPDPTVQRIFEYGMYRFGAMTESSGVPAGLQGPWLEDDKLVPWNGDYHFNINVQECYSPAYRGGHFANLMPLFRMILSWRPLLRDNALKLAGVDGYTLPHSVDDRGVCIGGFWAGTIDHASTAWVADMMFRYVRYSRDVDFLRESAYDFMKGAMAVYRAMMETDGDGLALPLAPSPEWQGCDVRRCVGRNASFQLAMAHRLARDLIAAAEMLGEKPDGMWLEVDRRLPAYARGEDGILIFEGQSLTESHRHHSHLAGLYPFDTIDLSDATAAKDVDAAYLNWVVRGTGAWTGWCVPWASVLNVHLGKAKAAVGRLHDWERYFCNAGHGSHHNSVADGFTLFTNGISVMQMDGQCAAATAAMELLVHEVNGKVEYFRGCPEDWREVSFENIALSDGRRVSGSRVNGKLTVR